jgi:Helix-turn-helix domain
VGLEGQRQRVTIDAYVTDVLMPDLVGHDHRPAAFVVYLFLLRHSRAGTRDHIRVSLQTIATRTGLSKSSVQSSIRHLKRRGLLDCEIKSTVSAPVRRILRPWVK